MEKCIICGKSFKNKNALSGHQSIHSKQFNEKIKIQHDLIVEKYLKNQKYCKNCNKPISFEKRNNIFCSQSCNASFNNKKRQKYEKHNCKNCNKEIYSRNKFCNKKCYGEFKSKFLLLSWLNNDLPSSSKSKIDKNGNILRRSDLFGALQTPVIRNFILNRQNNVCAICLNPFIWYNKPLRPILDHIDGNGFNNEPKNLRLICPNCNDQLITSSKKNNGRLNRWKACD